MRIGSLTKKVVRGLFIHHAFDHAATMAFYFFLGTIPLLVFVGLLVGGIIQREGAEELAAPLYRAMPRAASELLRHELYEIADTNAGSLAPLSLVGFFWLTTNGIHNLMDVFELLLAAKPRSWMRQRAIAIAWVLGMVLAIAATTWGLLFINGAASSLGSKQVPALLRRVSEFLAQGWQRAGVLFVFAGMTSVGLAIFYRTAVRHPTSVRRRVWYGTFTALALWSIVSWGFGTYVRTIAHYAVFYGSLATVAVILLWLYLTSLALLVGAEVNAILEGTRGPDSHPSAPHEP
jgi:membrane protein